MCWCCPGAAARRTEEPISRLVELEAGHAGPLVVRRGHPDVLCRGVDHALSR